MASLSPSVPNRDRALRQHERQSGHGGWFAATDRQIETLRRHPLASLALAVLIVWAAALLVSLISVPAAVWVTLALTLIAPVVVAGAYRGVAPAMLAMIPAIGIAIGVAIGPSVLGDGDSRALIVLALGATALLVAVAAVSNALTSERETADRSWLDAQESLTLSEEFIAFIAHEIRTPMTTIAGTADVLRRHEDSLSPSERREALADIVDEVMRLSDLADELLAIARRSSLRAGHLGAVPVAAVIDDTVRRHQKAFAGRRVVVSIDDPAAVVEASPVLTSHVLANLLNNAEKYSPPSEPIELHAIRKQSSVEIEVLDHGRGIPTTEASLVFSPFYRSASATSVEGHGLGLALCRKLMQVQGGQLWLEPSSAGRGSVFHIVIPSSNER